MPRVRNLVLRNSAEQRIRSVSAAYTLTMGDDDILLVNTTAASRTITLPPLADAYDAQLGVGKTFLVQKTTAANSLIIEGDGAETVNGAANQTLNTQWASVILIAGPSEWSMQGALTASTTDDDSITNAKMADDSVDSAEIVAGAIDAAHMSANSIDSDSYVDGSIDSAHFSAGAVDTTALGSGAVTPVKLSSSQVAPAANAACAIAATTTSLLLTVTDATNTAITTSAAEPGQFVTIYATSVAGGGSYTLAVSSGTLTFNATGEGAIVRRNHADDAWQVFGLSGATVV
jgi:hypothetical protein